MEVTEAVTSAEKVAQLFHETYERLSPSLGYETRKASAVPWEQVPENNRRLMIATVEAVLPAMRALEPRASSAKVCTCFATEPDDCACGAWDSASSDGDVLRSELRGVHDALGAIEDFEVREPDLHLTRDGCRAILRDAIAALSQLPSNDRVYQHAVRLAVALHEKHFDNPDWKPLPDIFGVIDQIDNMTTAWQPPSNEARLREALTLARNRLQMAAINASGTKHAYEYSEWADEATAALSNEGRG